MTGPDTARSAPSWEEKMKLVASDAAAGDFFGDNHNVSLDGDTVVVGAHGDDDHGSSSGSAYVFVKTGETWAQQAKLTASDGNAGDHFGFGVSLHGDTAIIGAEGDDDHGSSSGSAYVFVRSEGAWTQQAKLVPDDGAPSVQYGWDVSLDGNTAIIGARLDDAPGSNSGSAYVFVRSGTTWTQQAKLVAADGAPQDYFGASVSLDGDSLIVGAYGDDDHGSGSGSAYIFTRSGTIWTQQAKLVAADGDSGDAFGWDVAIADDTVIIGADGDDDHGYGSAYIFVREGPAWSQQGPKLTSDDPGNSGQYGVSVSLDGETAVVGDWAADVADNSAQGTVHVYTRAGTIWTQQAKLVAGDGDPGDVFGHSVSIDGDRIVVGADGNDDHGSNSGSAYIFASSEVTEVDTDGDGLPDSWEEHGINVAIDGTVSLCSPSPEPCDVPLHSTAEPFGADPLRKDVFLFIDWLEAVDHDHEPLAASLNRVRDAFATAPIPPRLGGPGIRLHYVINTAGQPEEGSSLGSVSDLSTCDWNLIGFIRDRPGGMPMAYRRVFHYGLFAHNACELGLSHNPSSDEIGLYEGASEFLVAQGRLDRQPNRELKEATTVMHELGHNLGLGHGGIVTSRDGEPSRADSINCKPNHLSVMNTLLATGIASPENFPGILGESSGVLNKGRLDYSRFDEENLADLHEIALSETVGFGSSGVSSTHNTIYFCPDNTLNLTGINDVPIDWDCENLGNIVASNINFYDDPLGTPPGSHNPCYFGLDNDEVLTTSNEWLGLVYNGGMIGALGRVPPEAPRYIESQEPTFREIEVLREALGTVKDRTQNREATLLTPASVGGEAHGIVSANSKLRTSDKMPVFAFVQARMGLVGILLLSILLLVVLAVARRSHTAR